MPHAVVEYSDNLSQSVYDSQLTAAVHDVMIQCGLFNTNDIKTRSYATSDWLTGTSTKSGGFVHVTISLMEGRTLEQKQELTQAMFETLSHALPNVQSLTVDIRDMTRETYRKRAG